MEISTSPLVGENSAERDRRDRLILFILWLMLAAWLWSTHVLWRDEARAFSLALSGSNYAEMLRNVHGEGHPALWYLILRGAHDLIPSKEVLPIAGAVFGIGAAALLAFLSPFRFVPIALVLFSGYGAFEYVAVARNYGIAAFVMLALAALYDRVRNSLWLGLILAILCNTNVPSCVLAAGFLLFRFVEMLTDGSAPSRREWLVFAGNAGLSAIGALLCFLTVYPTFNNAAVSPHFGSLGPGAIIDSLIDPERGFSHLIVGPVLVALCCVAFIRKPAALCAAVAAFLMLKLFYYFVYRSFYRHEVLFLFFLLSLAWMTANGAGGKWREKRWMDYVQLGGIWIFVVTLGLQTLTLVLPVREQLAGRPFSHSADVARLLKQPALSGAIVMADPDTMLEPLGYYTDNPLWMLRQQRFGKVVRLSEDARREITLDDVLADAERLHRQTGRPIVFLSNPMFGPDKLGRVTVMYDDTTLYTADSVRRFLGATRHIASLRGLQLGDEEYDVYVYPR